MAGGSPAGQPVPEHGLGQHRGGVQGSVAGVVHEHRHSTAGACGQGACPFDVLPCLGFGWLDPRNPADDVSTELEGLLTQVGGARIAQSAVLREGHNGDREHRPELFASRQHRVHALELSGRVDVDERLDVQGAVTNGLGQRPPHVWQECFTLVVRLHGSGRVDRRPRRRHPSAGVLTDGAVAQQRQRVDLVQMQVGIHERRRHQPAVGIDDDRGS